MPTKKYFKKMWLSAFYLTLTLSELDSLPNAQNLTYMGPLTKQHIATKKSRPWKIPWSSPASPRKTLSIPPFLLRLTHFISNR